jgi:DNA-binding NtrC family response regulator
MISERLQKLVEDMVDRGVQFDDAVREFERRFITLVLTRSDGRVVKAADALGMHRNTLSRKISEFKIKRHAG